MAAPASRRSTRSVVLRFAAVEAVVLVVCWTIFVGSFAGAEAVVGSLAVAIGTAVSTAAYAVGVARFQPKLTWIAEIWRVPWYVLADTGIIASALVSRHLFKRHGRSRMVAVPFEPGGWTGRGEARRALAITLTTLSPNSIVLDIDRDARLMLVHQISPAGVSRMTRRLSATGGRAQPRRRQ
jgi:multisubunit Na+/H+ antiporter MnhE subunit